MANGFMAKGARLGFGAPMIDKESARRRREQTRDLSCRGLDNSGVVLSVIDGWPVWKRVLKEGFPHAERALPSPCGPECLGQCAPEIKAAGSR